jgi:hypothetical protein
MNSWQNRYQISQKTSMKVTIFPQDFFSAACISQVQPLVLHIGCSYWVLTDYTTAVTAAHCQYTVEPFRGKAVHFLWPHPRPRSCRSLYLSTDRAFGQLSCRRHDSRARKITTGICVLTGQLLLLLLQYSRRIWSYLPSAAIIYSTAGSTVDATFGRQAGVDVTQ